MKARSSVQSLCETLEVSVSGYYGWRMRQAELSMHARTDQELSIQIEEIFAESRQTYGSPRIRRQLCEDGRPHSRKRVARLMCQRGLCARARRRYRPMTTDSRHDQPIAPNLLAEAPAPAAADRVWLGDITYIPTDEGWLYLAAPDL